MKLLLILLVVAAFVACSASSSSSSLISSSSSSSSSSFSSSSSYAIGKGTRNLFVRKLPTTKDLKKLKKQSVEYIMKTALKCFEPMAQDLLTSSLEESLNPLYFFGVDFLIDQLSSVLGTEKYALKESFKTSYKSLLRILRQTDNSVVLKGHKGKHSIRPEDANFYHKQMHKAPHLTSHEYHTYALTQQLRWAHALLANHYMEFKIDLESLFSAFIRQYQQQSNADDDYVILKDAFIRELKALFSATITEVHQFRLTLSNNLPPSSLWFQGKGNPLRKQKKKEKCRRLNVPYSSSDDEYDDDYDDDYDGRRNHHHRNHHVSAFEKSLVLGGTNGRRMISIPKIKPKTTTSKRGSAKSKIKKAGASSSRSQTKKTTSKAMKTTLSPKTFVKGRILLETVSASPSPPPPPPGQLMLSRVDSSDSFGLEDSEGDDELD